MKLPCKINGYFEYIMFYWDAIKNTEKPRKISTSRRIGETVNERSAPEISPKMEVFFIHKINVLVFQ